ncbi:unnamed protein product, partial [Prorocentrum cordatum]
MSSASQRARSEPRAKGGGGKGKSKGIGKAGKTNASGANPLDYVRCANCSYKWNFKARVECYNCKKPLKPAAVDKPPQLRASAWPFVREPWVRHSDDWFGYEAPPPQPAPPSDAECLAALAARHPEHGRQLEAIKMAVAPPPVAATVLPDVALNRAQAKQRRAQAAFLSKSQQVHDAEQWLQACREEEVRAGELVLACNVEVEEAYKAAAPKGVQVQAQEAQEPGAKTQPAVGLNVTALLAEDFQVEAGDAFRLDDPDLDITDTEREEFNKSLEGFVEQVKQHVRTTFGEAKTQLEQRRSEIDAKHQQLLARRKRPRTEAAGAADQTPAQAPAAGWLSSGGTWKQQPPFQLGTQMRKAQSWGPDAPPEAKPREPRLVRLGRRERAILATRMRRMARHWRPTPSLGTTAQDRRHWDSYCVPYIFHQLGSGEYTAMLDDLAATTGSGSRIAERMRIARELGDEAWNRGGDARRLQRQWLEHLQVANQDAFEREAAQQDRTQSAAERWFDRQSQVLEADLGPSTSTGTSEEPLCCSASPVECTEPTPTPAACNLTDEHRGSAVSSGESHCGPGQPNIIEMAHETVAHPTEGGDVSVGSVGGQSTCSGTSAKPQCDVAKYRPSAAGARRGKRRQRSHRRFTFHSVNASLSWGNVVGYLHGAAHQQLTEGKIPIIGFQAHGKRRLWAEESARALPPLGWRALLTPATDGPNGGASAGVLLAIHACVGVTLASGQRHWDISPPGCAGRLLMATLEAKGIGKLLVFCAYCFTGQKLASVGNSAPLSVITGWAVQLQLPWIVIADWENLPGALERSPWNNQLRGRVVAWQGEGGTNRSPHGERVIDYFWMHSSLAANISPARIDDDAVYHPHRATWVEFQQPWSAFTYTKLIRPHKFPIPGVKPRHFDLSCPDVPAGFDPDAVPTQELLDDTWEAFCHAAEEELIQKVGLDPSSRQADQCRGRGGPPRFRKCPLLPTHTEAIASYGEAKRWRWFANELAWLGIIEVKLFSYTGASDLVLTTLHQQRHASIRKLRDRFRHHMLLEGVAELQEFFEVFTSRDRGYEDLQELSAWRLSCSQYASYLEWQIGKERRDSFKQRLEDDFPGSQGLLHRVTKWRQAWQAPKGSISKKLLPAAPQAAVDQELHDWSKVWTTGSGFPKPWRGLQQVAVTPPSPHHLRGLAQRFRAKTGIGVDGWQPKLWAYLTDGTLSVLASLLAWCQQLGRWPSQVHLLLVFIIGKLDGGGRPIILLPGPCRIWEAWQLPTIRSWLAAHPRSYDYTAAGQSSERALWKALLDDELVLGTGIRAATMLADLAKCYEKVPHERMWWLAAWWGGPLEVVALALESFAFGRVIRLGEACSAEVLSSTALPAGSRFAPTFLRFYLTLCLDDLLGVFRLTIYLYVDDIALRVMSTEARVLHMLPQATRLLFWMLESFLGLEVARARDGARGKCSFLQTATPSSGLTQAMAALGAPPSTSERWLGIDYGPSVKTENQSAPVRHARLKIAKQRWPKIRGLPRARGGKLKMVVRQGLGASVAYGARVRGTPRPIVRFIQQKDRAVRRGATAFTSRVLHDGLDPSCADTLVLAPLLAWAREAWDHPEGRRAQATAWARVQQQLALYMDADAQELWSVVRGPAGATSVTVRAHGWSMPSAFEIVLPPRGGVLQGGDVHLDLLQICPKSVEAAVLLAARSRALCQWAAAQPERAALLPAPWLTPARQLVKRRKQDGWLQHHADAVKKAVLGGFPSQEALFSSGQADTPHCQLCDDTTCFGTHQHYYWRCGSPTCATVREQLTAHDASPTFRDVGHLGVSASSSEASRWLWERGLRRTPCYGLAWSLPSQRTHWIVNGAAPELTDVLVSDGSVKGLDDLRHGGWAALQCTAEADDVVQGLYGPLPFPDPSSVLAELWGLLHALRHSVFITAIIIDNAQVVQGLARGRAWCCSAARPYAHVWLEIWDRLDDMDILPGRELSVIKVASHISQAKRLELPEEVQIHMRHNDLADEWAKQGADLSAPPEWATLQVKQELKATKRVLEYIGHFRVLLDGVKLAEPRHPHVLEVCRGYSKCTNCGKAPPPGLCDSEQTMEIRDAHGYDDTDEFAALSVHSDLEDVDDGATAGAGAAPVPTVPPAAQPAGEPGADQGELASSLDVDGKAATQAAAAVCSAPLAAHQARAGQGSLKHGGKAPRTGSSASSAAAAGSGQGGLAPLAGSPPPSAGAAAASEPERGARGRAASAQPARSGQALPATARAASSEPRPHTVEIIGNFVVCVVCGSYYSSVARNLGGPCRRLDPRDPGDKERLRRIRRIQRGQ